MAIYVGDKRYAPYIGDKRRRYMGGSSSLPYDAEIEWLESSGTQWIDTGYSVNTNDMFKYEIKGSFTSTRENQFICGLYASCYFGCGIRGQWVLSNYTFGTSDTQIHDITLFSQIGNNKQSILILDGTIYRYTRNNNGGILFLFTINNYQPSFSCRYRMIKCTLKINDVLVRDFIPVRIGTTGYLYDKVSGQLFGNAGTGDFILGPDKT